MLSFYLHRALFKLKLQKIKILVLFFKHIQYAKIVYENKHCGSEGHWLEDMFNIKHNSSNTPDIYGFELKKQSNKITLGDFSCSEYLFSKNKPFIDSINCSNIKITRNEFISLFGSSKIKDRYSWSGECIPKYGIWNDYGQILMFDDFNNLYIKYSSKHDKRNLTYNNILNGIEELVIAYWSAEKLKKCINKKFNSNGFVICSKYNNVYSKISFGLPFNFTYFIENIKNGMIIFDSGMYTGNNRNYSMFRSKNKDFWNNLIYKSWE